MRTVRTSQRVLDAVRAITSKPLPVHYALPYVRVTIGYSRRPDDGQLQVVGAAPGTYPTCTIVADDTVPNLFWLDAKQDEGAVLYQWVGPNGAAHKFLLYAHESMYYATDRAQTAGLTNALRRVWRVTAATGLPEPFVTELLRTVRGANDHGTDRGMVAYTIWRLLQESSSDPRMAAIRLRLTPPAVARNTFVELAPYGDSAVGRITSGVLLLANQG